MGQFFHFIFFLSCSKHIEVYLKYILLMIVDLQKCIVLIFFYLNNLIFVLDNSNNYAKLSSQYEGGSKASSSTQEIKRGLLGALTDSEVC